MIQVYHIDDIIEDVYFKNTLSAYSYNKSVAIFNWCQTSIESTSHAFIGESAQNVRNGAEVADVPARHSVGESVAS